MDTIRISPATIRSLLDYQPDTGKLFWLLRSPDWFTPSQCRTSEHVCALWNSRYAGSEALTANINGYRAGMILGQPMRAHRAAFAWMTGDWPKADIDHINGRRNDNRWTNLRDASRLDNGRNQKLHSTNSSGFGGVSFDADKGLWRARITVAGQAIYLGRFKSFDAAAGARAAAERRYGFHENHGRVA